MRSLAHLMLRTSVLHRNADAGGFVSESNGRLGLVDVLCGQKRSVNMHQIPRSSLCYSLGHQHLDFS